MSVFLTFTACKGCFLDYGCMAKTIAGVEFPLRATFASNGASTAVGPGVFNYTPKSAPRSLPPVAGGEMCGGKNKNKNMVFHLGNMWGEVTPRAICLECFMVTDVTLTAAAAAAAPPSH